jgi:hypothetical protein
LSVALLSASLALGPAWAQVPMLDLSDLVNQGSDHAEREQRNRGYAFIYADPRGSKIGQYWWQSRDDVCACGAYVGGHNAGQQKRQAETSYRSPYGDHTGLAAYVPLNDLVGARASSMDGEMQRRGFMRHGGRHSGGQALSPSWNTGTRQCMQAVFADGRVRSISSLYDGNCT